MNLLWIGLMSVLLVSSCTSSKEVWLETRSDLTQFLSQQVGEPLKEVTFQVCDAKRTPIQYGLLRFDWEDNGGRMSFQTDKKGTIKMVFEADFHENQVWVSIDEKTIGQFFLDTDNYESSTRSVGDGLIRATW